MKECKEYDCGNNVFAKNMCKKHYSRFIRNGNTSLKRFIGDEKSRFLQKFIINQTTGCWEWTYSLDNFGYGRFWFRGKLTKAHRVSWILNVSEIPEKSWVLHHCDNPKCINPSHLFLGDRTDNMRDMAKKGRQVFQISPEKASRGSSHYNSKLNENQVTEILLTPYSKMSCAKMSEKFGVSSATISAIKTGRRWQHLYHGIDKTNPRAEIEIREIGCR